ncbi:MAG TPA: hypothetical protein V6C76_10615 [Drouetiella sp.]
MEREDESNQLVPSREGWLWQNPKHAASILRGIAQARAGKLITISLDDPQTSE